MVSHFLPSGIDTRPPLPPVFYGVGKITVRPFAWYDLPNLLRNRSRMICLNKDQLLTHGNPLGFAALASRLKPTAESFTGVFESSDSTPCLFSQLLHQSGDRSARLNFLVIDHPDESGVAELWDYLCYKAGEMGAVNVLAELEENDALFETFRRAGFTAYGWESAWKFPQNMSLPSASDSRWSIAAATDEPQIRSLFQSLVPPIAQAAETFTNGETRRLVYREKDEIIAYIESSQGPRGLYLKPLIHPAAADITTLLTDLGSQFSGLGQSVYLQVRSYQAWLLNALESIGGESSARFNLLVKHLAILQRNGVLITNRKLVENRHAEPTAPIVNNLMADDPPSSK
jgi:hypothetical protein